MNIRRAPDLTDLRRVWAWQPCPWGGGPADRQAVAWHEAGHVVYAQWIGWGVRCVELHNDGGHSIPEPLSLEGAPQHSDLTGRHRATAAGLFHAGLAAELIQSGAAWQGPIARPRQTDHDKAERMLSIGFGANTIAGHAYAQLQAMHALSAHWDEVAHVAEVLLRAGKWEPETPHTH